MTKITILNVLFVAICSLYWSSSFSQSTIITDDASHTTPASGAVLDVNSDTKGISIPNVALTSLSSSSPVSSPVDGLMVYNTATAGTAPDNVTPGFYYWTGSSWSKVMVGGNEDGNTTIEADGTIIFNGDATGWEDLRVPGLTAKYAGSQPPTLGPFGSSGNLLVNRFNGGSSVNAVYINVQMPHSWKSGSTIYPHIHWSPTTTDAGSVKWNFEYCWIDYGSTFSSTTTISATQASGGTAWKHQIASFPAISGTGHDISSILIIRLFRDPTDGSDTYEEDAAFIDFDIHYEINSVGSHTDFTK